LRFFVLATTLAAALGLTACVSVPEERADPYAALTDNDVAIAAMLLQRTLDHAPDGTTRRWTNDQSGHSGAITPVRSYIATTGQYCRDYQEDISVGDERRQFHYSACRDEDRWGL
jgi:surface antigen